MSDESTDPKSIPEHRKMAIELFNHTWSLIDLKQRTPDQIDEMIHSAYASSYHWLRGGEPANQARGHWQISRVYVVAERSEPALYHATRCLSLCKEIGLQDWDLAFGYEGLARSYSLAGDSAKTKQDLDLARSVPIEKKEYREPLESDLSTITIPT